jgi:hypothetical protein
MLRRNCEDPGEFGVLFGTAFPILRRVNAGEKVVVVPGATGAAMFPVLLRVYAP